MGKEAKIVLPIYKIIYASCFVLILSLVRGVAYTNEIGIALESPLAILVAVFCADTYVIEISSKRSEIARLYPIKKRSYSVYKRLLIQILFLIVLASLGYGMFVIFQHPVAKIFTSSVVNDIVSVYEWKQFFMFLLSIIVTISFWGTLSNMLALVVRNMWGGIGGSIIIWLGLNSIAGDKLLGKWNVFSYTFRDIQNFGDFNWLYGKGICICIIAVIIILIPLIIKKRG